MKTSLVLGFFDGVHKGHQEVIRAASDYAQGGEVILLTMADSPEKFFNKQCNYIYSRKNSISKTKEFGITKVVSENFENIHNQTDTEFLERIVHKYKPDGIFTGFNYTFGINKTGSPKVLEQYQEKYNYKYFCIPPFKINEEIVSSTIIKKYLSIGNINYANELLGTNFILEGQVIQGAKLGRTIGFPTANMEYPDHIIKIPYGVYAIKLGQYAGIMNYGMKPTINNITHPIIETHIINYDEDLYGKNIRIDIISRIRNEQKFNCINDLKEQLEKDKNKCLELLS